MTLSTLDPVPALVAIDLQRGIASGRETTPHPLADVIARSAELADAFRARGLPVILVRVTLDGAGFSPGRSDRPRAGGTPPEGWDEIVDELAGHPTDVVVTKRNVGGFVGTDLDLQLRRRGVTQVLFTGVATSMGVEGTARAAHDHGYHVVLVTDAMADTDEATHHHSVGAIFPKIGETTTTAEVLATLGAPAAV
ncbi:isochorismatase family protein [Actinomycetospora endophytica]|uniref:Isochorismatase family protein n=1 Tax=Actinomycetospora endophytica TaxID=2291215 RepID=A0ABS8PD96_9PSEU|nr:isochorismatase family protein [Actinomycetospora endophytica]MCD2196253.1 isochorismatase family protein [Actinomycetospora endophytica]